MSQYGLSLEELAKAEIEAGVSQYSSISQAKKDWKLQQKADSTTRRFIPSDNLFKPINAVAPYRIMKFYPNKPQGYVDIEYISSESPLLRNGRISIKSAYKLGLQYKKFTKPNVVFAQRGEKAYFNQFKALEQMTELLYYPRFNWKSLLNTIGQAAQVVAPALQFIPGAGQILSPLVGQVGKQLNYATR